MINAAVVLGLERRKKVINKQKEERIILICMFTCMMNISQSELDWYRLETTRICLKKYMLSSIEIINN